MIAGTVNTRLDPPHIFLSVAEPSADLHASTLIRGITALCPQARFTGIAGPRMQQAGCESIYDMTQYSSMLTAALRHVHHGYKMLSITKQELARNRYDAAVVIDSPILNLRVARTAKKQKLPVLYYIAPQLWAWGWQYRIANVRTHVDRIACILPFEEPYFRSYGIDARYVGHPLFAALAEHRLDEELIQQYKRAGTPVLVIMPGSRRHEAAENFPGQLDVAKKLKTHFPNMCILVSVANRQVKSVLDQLAKTSKLDIEFHEGKNGELLSAADLALVKSGTSTLEAAFYKTPMIVMYNGSRMLYQLAQWVIHTRYFSLPNILAGRKLVPEFMPYYTSTKPIVSCALELLSDPKRRTNMAKELGMLIQPFVNTTAADTTAKILLDLIESRNDHPRSPQPSRSSTI